MPTDLVVELQLDKKHASLSERACLELCEGESAIVGRKKRSNWMINDPRLSSKHFEVFMQAGKCWLADLESTNGTRVNGKTIKKRELKNGDTISAGQVEFKVVFEFAGGKEFDEFAVDETIASSMVPMALQQKADSRTAVTKEDFGESTKSPDRQIQHEIEYCTIRVGGDRKRSVALAPNEVVSFGSSSSSNQEIEDELMRSKHFKVKLTSTECLVRAYHKSNPIEVNDQKLHKAKLFNGDVIAAGRTTFEIQLFGPDHLISRTEELGDSDFDAPVVLKNVKPKQTVGCDSVRLPNGLAKVSGQDNFHEVAENLGIGYGTENCFRVADWFRGREQDQVEEANRISAQALQPFGSYLASFDPNDTASLDRFWSLDYSLLLFAKTASVESLLEFLRSAELNGRGSFFDTCWPSVQRSVIESAPTKLVEQIFTQIHCLFIEPEEPKGWLLFVPHEKLDVLRDVGFQITEEPFGGPQTEEHIDIGE